MAAKQKATISEFDPCMVQHTLDIFYLLSDKLLLEIAQTYDIDIGDTHNSRNHRLSMMRGYGDPESVAQRPVEVEES